MIKVQKREADLGVLVVLRARLSHFGDLVSCETLQTDTINPVQSQQEFIRISDL